jgi:CheY-like chemotaxis protein
MHRTVLVLVDDLFWRTKIDHAVRSAQSIAVFITDPAQLVTAADPATVGVVLVDLSLRKEPFTAIASLKKSPTTKGIAVVGYYEHVRKDIQKKGIEAGCDRVLPRSSFSAHLGDMVLQYALPGGVRTEEEETELPEE